MIRIEHVENKEEKTKVTLDESAEYELYNGTRAFYRKERFCPLEVFTCVWDEENPCLFMVKVLDR